MTYEPPTQDEPGGLRWEGIFVARDCVRYVAGRKPERDSAIGGSNEDKMLAVLFSAYLHPLSDDRIAESCQTPEGLRTEYASLIRRAEKMFRGARARADDAQYRPASGDFDCLLFLGGTGGPFATQGSRMVSTQYGSARDVELIVVHTLFLILTTNVLELTWLLCSMKRWTICNR